MLPFMRNGISMDTVGPGRKGPIGQVL